MKEGHEPANGPGAEPGDGPRNPGSWIIIDDLQAGEPSHRDARDVDSPQGSAGDGWESLGSSTWDGWPGTPPGSAAPPDLAAPPGSAAPPDLAAPSEEQRESDDLVDDLMAISGPVVADGHADAAGNHRRMPTLPSWGLSPRSFLPALLTLVVTCLSVLLVASAIRWHPRLP